MNKIKYFIQGGSVVRWFGGSDSMKNNGLAPHRFSWILGVLILFLMSFGMAAFSNPSSNWQSSQPTFDRLYSGDFENYWPILNDMKNGQCNATTDFVIGIPPGGCSPSVVTSDLLAEQNVPVFCQLYAIKVNPLIKVSSIKSISFKGDYPEGVRSVVYHPARAAVKSYTTLLGDPTLENIGYVVIILKQEKVEANMEEWIAGNLTATMKYDAEEAYGTGKGDYYLEPMSDNQWSRNYLASSFWNGRGYLRVLDVGDGGAKIQVMRDKNTVLRTLTLKEGETSSSSYLPGFYCKAGLKVKLTDITTQEDMARLNVDGQDIWVRKGSKFLDGKCSVSRLDIKGNNDGEISIRCSGAGKIEPLVLRGGVVRLSENKNEEAKEYNVGDKFGEKVVVAYGKLGVSKSPYVVLGSSMVEGVRLKEILSLSNSVDDFEKFEEAVKKIKGVSGLEVLSEEDPRFAGMGIEVKDEDKVNKYFDMSVSTVRDELVEYYGSEERELGDTWAEGELYAEIVLAGKWGEFETQKVLMDLFLDEYPLSDIADYVRDMRAKLDGTDYSRSFTNVFVGDEFRSISVVDFKAVGEGEKNVDFRVGNVEFNRYNESNNISLKDSGDLTIEDISPGKVRVRFKTKVKDPTGDERSRTVWIDEGESEVFDGINVYVREIRVKQVAHVSLIPDVKHEKSEADFTFRIGIEKRAIELSPDKAKKMIVNLDKSIEKWENIVERLGNVVTGLKGACFATSAVLMIKSMATGASGKAAARTRVMADYKKKCATEHKDMTPTECYNELGPEIEADVVAMTAVLAGVNAKMEAAQVGNTKDSGGFLGGKGIVNRSNYLEDLKKQISSDPISVSVGGDNESVPKSRLYTESQVRAVLTWEESRGKGAVERVAKADMDNALRGLALEKRGDDEKLRAVEELKSRGVDGEIKIQSYVGEKTVLLRWDGQTEDDEGKIKMQYLNYNGKNYKLYLDGVVPGNLGVTNVLSHDGRNWAPVDNAVSDELSRIVFSGAGDSGSCSNVWPKGTAKISYYESGENKGLPAIVPFDLQSGWYAMVANSGGTYVDSSPKGYTASADVNHFKICNIGSNGLMQSCTGDDLAQTFNVNSVGDVKDFVPCPGMSSSEVSKLYGNAREAIRQASDQYGKKSVTVLGEAMAIGEPMGKVGGFECQDFMSPEDCKTMFNVCDPVICPPSRCDFGGKFPVSDVIQTGIIGSLVLCLPNAKEGIIMPICLSGVQAGLDAYLSILKSEKDCLEHSLETGELVGICDQITSIYKCEFFWRQLSPLMDQMIPGVIDYAINGDRVRGGGEYALVQQSWNTMKSGVSYFKDTYAQNAFRAFNIRSTQEIGSSVCKAFVGTSAPGSANFIENLLKPESPSQFYAQFSEKIFSEATAPSTSQYKVYYHIFAGNDEGVQYKVYLKNPPASSYYASNPEVQVKTGYIAAGSSADESIDFTAPSGYKELCVVINAQEECGFKQVTSSFGIDFLGSKYVEEQVEDSDITTEKECISGNPSALSMATLNLQGGAEEVVNPEIAMRGIVRVCASTNPDAGVVSEDWVQCKTNESCSRQAGFYCGDSGYCESKSEAGLMQKHGSRWKDVGYCGDSGLRCWLDVDSVKGDLETIETFSDVLGGIGDKSLMALNERRGLIDSGVLDLVGVAKLLSKARIDIKDLTVSRSEPDGLKIVGELDRVIGNDSQSGAGTNGDRAEALALKASVYRLLVGLKAAEKAEKVVEARIEINNDFDGVDLSEEVDCNAKCEGYLDYSRGVLVEDAENCGEIGGAYFGECCCFADLEDNIIEEDILPERDCRNEIGERIIEIAGQVKRENGISDATIKNDKVADCFEELALMIGMQESGLRHCEDESKDCFDCDGKLIMGSDGISMGVMQINKEKHEIDYGNFDVNVKYALERVLWEWGYKLWKDGKEFNGVNYVGWEAALRAYNGWGLGGDDNYVENVLRRRGEVEEMFPDACKK